ncbi:MAG: SGNH/GDSL hydrolase family protein [Lachnospiraceae bacterium]|nr:SGNH/GDSL hydrolase family protein [Lachnospiraceae bacterium]
MMRNIEGISFSKTEKYSLFLIHELSDEIKEIIRAQLATICHGENNVNAGYRMYSYKSTIKEFLRRYKDKPENIQIGMIGELLVHIIFSNYFDEYRAVTPYFNLEERSIKKGYDVVLAEVAAPRTLWITEVKSGKLHNNKNATQTMNDLLGTAKRDLDDRLNKENVSLWMEAISGARASFDDNNTMKEAVIDVLANWGDAATDGNYTSGDKNVVLTGVLFSNIVDTVDEISVGRKQENIENEETFNQIYILAVQKSTYIKVIDFLKEEATDEEL